jgi:purine catabolism regulator
LSECYKEALITLGISKARGFLDFITGWNDLGSLKLIGRVAADREAKEFCLSVLKDIADGASKESKSLLDTLIFLEKNNWNLREVARKMFYHHNTIKHRYSKIQEIIGRDMSSAETRFDISLAIRILQSIPKWR